MQNARCAACLIGASRGFSSISARPFSVLGIESSADDTCAAVVTSDKRVLANVVVRQHKSHEKWGGIHPLLALQAHQKNMHDAVRSALDDAGLEINQIDGIAFTRGPGMRSCLAVGANAAKTLACVMRKPLVGVHHMQAHVLTANLTSSTPPTFPFLALLVSGGHTMLLLATSPTSFQMLASTGDISIGQAFDKVSRDLNLPWSLNSSSPPIGAGPMLEHVASTYDPASPVSLPSFPIPVPGVLSFSYGGLLSAVQRCIEQTGVKATNEGPVQAAIAHAFQHAAVRQLEKKLSLALRICGKQGIQVRTLVASGGVASNRYLRSRLESYLQQFEIQVHYPPISFCTDNAAMIAWASMERFLSGDTDPYDIDLRPKWSIEDLRKPNEEILLGQ